MFGFIKKLFSGIFAFLGGLIGGKKAKDDASDTPKIAPKAKPKKTKGYYLELDETGNTKLDVTALKPELAKVAVALLEKKPDEVEKKPEPVLAAVATAPAPAKVEPAVTAKKAKTAKAKAQAPAAEAENGKVKIEAQPNPPAETNGKASDQVTFAPNYLMPTTSSSRRRPGPNMNTFLDMARKAKTPG